MRIKIHFENDKERKPFLRQISLVPILNSMIKPKIYCSLPILICYFCFVFFCEIVYSDYEFL